MKSEKRLSDKINILMVAVILYFFILIPIGFKKFPVLFVIIILSWVPLLLLMGICGIVVGVKSDRFLQNHNFGLWKKTKSSSFKEKMEAQREIRNLDLLNSIKLPRFQALITFLSICWEFAAFSILIFITIKLIA